MFTYTLCVGLHQQLKHPVHNYVADFSLLKTLHSGLYKIWLEKEQ